MSTEHDNNDLDRASWEGMADSAVEESPPKLAKLFIAVKAAFDSNHTFFGFSDALISVLRGYGSDDLFDTGINFTREETEKFEKEVVPELRSQFKDFLGDNKWRRFEMESMKRHLRNDLIGGGTPG